MDRDNVCDIGLKSPIFFSIIETISAMKFRHLLLTLSL